MTLDLGARTEIDRDELVETLAAALEIIVADDDGVYRLESRLEGEEEA
jgi:hypothetical protein